jgi:hypothetical protein
VSFLGDYHTVSTFRDVPWQIWVVVVILGVEGVFGNLPAISTNPVAISWFAAKCLFVVGLLKRWRWVFWLFLILASLPVLRFSIQAPLVALVNLVLVLLTASARGFYFPHSRAKETSADIGPPPTDSDSQGEVVAPRGPRRWFQYRLRTLMVVMLAVSLGMSWLAVELNRAGKQRAIVQAVENAGARIEYRDPLHPTLRRTVNRHLFCDVFAVIARSAPSFRDEQIKCLAQLPTLKALELTEVPITDAGLKHLEPLTDLEYLFLTGVPITDTGLDHLRRLPRLRGLYLLSTDVTAEGVERLQQALPRCRIRWD